MDAVFVFSEKAARDREGHIYIGTSLTQEVFDRYLEHFDHLIVMMRREEAAFDDPALLAGMNLLTDSRIRVVFLPDTLDSARHFVDPRIRRDIREILEREIGFGNAVILRLHSYYSYIAAKICVKRGIPYLAEAVGCPFDSLSHHSIKGKILAPSAVLRMRYSMRHASYAIYVTRRFLQKRYPTRGMIASVSDVELAPLDDEILEKRLDKIRDYAEQPEKKLLIGTAAAVHIAYKGHRFVFKALANLKKQGCCRFEYHMAGGGDNSKLRKLAHDLNIEELVVFDGQMAHSQIFNWLDALDLYIQPSEQEGLSRALIEAMSRALPALASDVGGNPELLESSCIHKCGDVREIKRALLALTPERMLKMAERNFREAGKYEKKQLQRKRKKVLAAYAEKAASSFAELTAIRSV